MDDFIALLDQNHIVTGINVSSKKALFELVATHISNLHPGLADEELVCTLMQRERLGSTCIGEGIAVPHCRLADNKKSIVGLFTLASPIIYNDDDEMVDIIAVLLVPENATDIHLHLLSQIASSMQTKAVRTALRQSNTSEQVMVALQRAATPYQEDAANQASSY